MTEYRRYSEQKRWNVNFAYSASEDVYFQAEFGEVVFRGQKIIEIGFGKGSFLAFARERGAEIFGIEIQSEIVEKARASGYPAFGSLNDLADDHSESFDAIIALDVFEHLSHEMIDQTLATIHRLLKSGGVLILRSPNGQSPFGRRTQYGDRTHVSVITPKKMEQMCFATGLEVVKTANQARVSGVGNLGNSVAKRLQFFVRDLCNLAVSKIYGMGTTVLDENIVIWIKKTGVPTVSETARAMPGE